MSVEANRISWYQSLCHCLVWACVSTEDTDDRQKRKMCSVLVQTGSPGWRTCDDGALYKGKYSAISHCKSFCSDKNPFFTVKKTVLFKYEYRTEFLLFRNQKSVKSEGRDPPPHYNSMSWASSSEKSDMELSEDESPPPSSCSFRASSVAYRWMYSEMRHRQTGVHMMNRHCCFACLIQIFLKNTDFTEQVRSSEGYTHCQKLVQYLLSCVYILLAGGGTGPLHLHSEGRWGWGRPVAGAKTTRRCWWDLVNERGTQHKNKTKLKLMLLRCRIKVWFVWTPFKLSPVGWCQLRRKLWSEWKKGHKHRTAGAGSDSVSISYHWVVHLFTLLVPSGTMQRT